MAHSLWRGHVRTGAFSLHSLWITSRESQEPPCTKNSSSPVGKTTCPGAVSSNMNHPLLHGERRPVRLQEYTNLPGLGGPHVQDSQASLQGFRNGEQLPQEETRASWTLHPANPPGFEIPAYRAACKLNRELPPLLWLSWSSLMLEWAFCWCKCLWMVPASVGSSSSIPARGPNKLIMPSRTLVELLLWCVVGCLSEASRLCSHLLRKTRTKQHIKRNGFNNHQPH